ncbi:MAG: chromosomal replication initiator protein DnaA [Oscillospiraceae bacterium]|nr:chromosomal replication initiator protein DnaA [Oscillospiraceae bacterium]
MKSLSDLWDSILARLSGELSDMTIKTWFDEITVVTMEDSALVLHCSNPFKKNTVEARFLPHIKAALKDIFSTDLEVKILSDEQLAAYHGVAPDRPGNLFDSDAFTFETYVVGPQNKLAYAAAKAVAEKPAEGFNPLFIYGESGLGKTHLLYAIAHLMRSRRPESRIVYIKGDDFTNELVSSIRENRNAEFREKYRQADILLVDDIQFIAGKIQTQEEFFHTFNTLYESGKQIVLTSDRPPREMTQLSDRLMSRFESGLMVDVAPPDFETRLAIIHNKAALLGVKLPDEVMDYIAENVTTNVRQLEGTLNKILAYRDLLGDQVDEESVGRAVRDMLKRSNEYVPSPKVIISYICSYYNIDEETLRGQSRSRDVVAARQLAMYLIRRMHATPLDGIGKEFGNRDHSTILHSLDKVEKQMQTDPKFAERVKEITTNISSKR